MKQVHRIALLSVSILLWTRIQPVASQRGVSSTATASFSAEEVRLGGQFRRVTRMRVLEKDAKDTKSKDTKSKGHNIFDKHQHDEVVETDGADSTTTVVVVNKGSVFQHMGTHPKSPKDWKSSRAPQYFKGYQQQPHETEDSKSKSKHNAFAKESDHSSSSSSSSMKESKSKDVKHPFFPFDHHNNTSSPTHYSVTKGKGKGTSPSHQSKGHDTPDHLTRKTDDSNHSTKRGKRLTVGKGSSSSSSSSLYGGYYEPISKGKGVYNDNNNTTLAPSLELPSKGKGVSTISKGKGLVVPPPIYIPLDKKKQSHTKSTKSHIMSKIWKHFSTITPTISTSSPTTLTRMPTRPPVPTLNPTTSRPDSSNPQTTNSPTTSPQTITSQPSTSETNQPTPPQTNQPTSRTSQPTMAPVPTVSPVTSSPAIAAPQTSAPTNCEFFGGIPLEVCIAIDESGSICGTGLCIDCECFDNPFPDPSPITAPDDCCANFRSAIEFSVELIQGYASEVQDFRAAVSYFSTRVNNPDAVLANPQDVIDDLNSHVYSGGWTFTGGGFAACTDILNAGNPNAKKLMIVPTDGDPTVFFEESDGGPCPDDDFEDSGEGTFFRDVAGECAAFLANEARDAGIDVIPVGVGDEVTQSNLEVWAGSKFFSVPDFSDLRGVSAELLTNTLCAPSSEPSSTPSSTPSVSPSSNPTVSPKPSATPTISNAPTEDRTGFDFIRGFPCDNRIFQSLNSNPASSEFPMFIPQNASDPNSLCFLRMTPDIGGQGALGTSAFLGVPVSFPEQFSFKMSIGYRICGAEDGSADGMVFVMHQDPRGAEAIGNTGGGIGVYGNEEQTIKPAITIEWDTFENPGRLDVGQNNVHAIQVNEDASLIELGQTAQVPIRTGDDCETVGRMWVEYNCGGNQQINIWNTVTGSDLQPTFPVLSIPAENLEDFFFQNDNNILFVGYTSSIGGQADNHDIYGWEFQEGCRATDIPPRPAPLMDWEPPKMKLTKSHDNE